MGIFPTAETLYISECFSKMFSFFVSLPLFQHKDGSPVDRWWYL